MSRERRGLSAVARVSYDPRALSNASHAPEGHGNGGREFLRSFAPRVFGSVRCFSVSLFLRFSVSLFLCFSVSLFLCFLQATHALHPTRANGGIVALDPAALQQRRGTVA